MDKENYVAKRLKRENTEKMLLIYLMNKYFTIEKRKIDEIFENDEMNPCKKIIDN